MVVWDDYKYLKYILLVYVWLIIYIDGIGGLEFFRNLEIFIELIR